MKKSTKIVFFGDSVTEGCFEIYPCSYGFETVKRPEDGYAVKTIKALRQKHGELSFEYENFAKRGYSAHTARSQLDTLMLSGTDIAVLCFGLNDALHPEKRFGTALTDMFAKLKSTVSTVVFMTPNMMNTYLHPQTLPCARKVAEKTMAAQTDGKFDCMMEQARLLCAENGIVLCDAYAHWKAMYRSGLDTTELLVNRINHPRAEMHDVFAQMLTDIIENI